MEHLTYEDIREYIDMQEYSPSNADRFEQLFEHLMECEKCSAMYQQILHISLLVDEFSLKEYDGYLSLEQRLVERYQMEKLLMNAYQKPIEDRIKQWIERKLKGLESSVKIYLKDERYHRISGMVRNMKDFTSFLNTLEPVPAFAMRGDAAESRSLSNSLSSVPDMNMSTMLVSKEGKETKVVLDGNLMQLMVQLEDKPAYHEKSPVGILIGNSKDFDPMIQVAENRNGLYYICFANLPSGEYTFYLDT